MEQRFISFGSIEQMPTVIKNVKRQAQFIGVDENGDAIYDSSKKAKPVTVTMSEKIHGTNAAVCYNNRTGFYVQSRKNIITPEKDNAGCAFAQTQNKEVWIDIIENLSARHDIDLDKYIISIFFEWAGGSIQKNACVSGLDKSAFIFQHFKVSPLIPLADSDGQMEPAKWFETSDFVDDEGDFTVLKIWVEHPESNIYNVMNFPTWEVELDFERPDLARNKIIELVEKTIEPNSPLGCALYNSLYGGQFTIIDGKIDKYLPDLLKIKLENIKDGTYTLSF